MKAYALPFAVAFVACVLLFVGLDAAIMKMMGLTLIYQP